MDNIFCMQRYALSIFQILTCNLHHNWNYTSYWSILSATPLAHFLNTYFLSHHARQMATYMRHLVNIWQMTSRMQRSACPQLSKFGLVFVIPKKADHFHTSKWTNVCTNKCVAHTTYVYQRALYLANNSTNLTTFCLCQISHMCSHLQLHPCPYA